MYHVCMWVAGGECTHKRFCLYEVREVLLDNSVCPFVERNILLL